MSNPFQVWVDRLKSGQNQQIQETALPDFLELAEEELEAEVPVKIEGKAYLTESELILHLKAETKITMPCSICNQMIPVDLEIEDFYHAEPLDKIPSGIFDFRALLREALLIELPQYIECNQGKCSSRRDISPYLKEKTKKEDTHFPFSNLEP